MLEARQGFGEEVRDVFLAGHMLNAELPLPNAILQPVKAHVDALRQSRRHGFVGKANSTLIVAQQQRRRLGVA